MNKIRRITQEDVRVGNVEYEEIVEWVNEIIDHIEKLEKKLKDF